MADYDQFVFLEIKIGALEAETYCNTYAKCLEATTYRSNGEGLVQNPVIDQFSINILSGLRYSLGDRSLE